MMRQARLGELSSMVLVILAGLLLVGRLVRRQPFLE